MHRIETLEVGEPSQLLDRTRDLPGSDVQLGEEGCDRRQVEDIGRRLALRQNILQVPDRRDDGRRVAAGQGRHGHGPDRGRQLLQCLRRFGAHLLARLSDLQVEVRIRAWLLKKMFLLKERTTLLFIEMKELQ